MGFSLGWLAAKDRPLAAVYDALDLQGTGRRAELPESPYQGAELPGGWSLVVEDHGDARVFDEGRLARVSAGTEVVTCFVEEHVMFSTATGWRNGRRVWSVTHALEKGPKNLDVEGEPPGGFAAIRERLLQALEADGGPGVGADHLFDAPVELAKAVCGYRHDEDIAGGGAEPFEVLAPRPAKSSVWARLFRKG